MTLEQRNCEKIRVLNKGKESGALRRENLGPIEMKTEEEYLPYIYMK